MLCCPDRRSYPAKSAVTRRVEPPATPTPILLKLGSSITDRWEGLAIHICTTRPALKPGSLAKARFSPRARPRTPKRRRRWANDPCSKYLRRTMSTECARAARCRAGPLVSGRRPCAARTSFTARRIVNSWLEGASAFPVGLTTGGIVLAAAADGPAMQTKSTAATTLRRRWLSGIRWVGAAGYCLSRITRQHVKEKRFAGPGLYHFAELSDYTEPHSRGVAQPG